MPLWYNLALVIGSLSARTRMTDEDRGLTAQSLNSHWQAVIWLWLGVDRFRQCHLSVFLKKRFFGLWDTGFLQQRCPQFNRNTRAEKQSQISNVTKTCEISVKVVGKNPDNKNLPKSGRSGLIVEWWSGESFSFLYTEIVEWSRKAKPSSLA